MIGSGAFKDCYLLNEIELPYNLKRINSHTFENCLSLSNFVIRNEVQVVGSYAFKNCPSLKKITISNPKVAIRLNAFDREGITVVIFKGTEKEYSRIRHLPKSVSEVVYK